MHISVSSTLHEFDFWLAEVLFIKKFPSSN